MDRTEREMLENQAKLYRDMLEEVPGNGKIIRGLMNISKVLKDRKSVRQYREMLEVGKKAHREMLLSTAVGRKMLKVLDRHAEMPKEVLKKEGLRDFNSDYEMFTRLDIHDSRDHMYFARELLLRGNARAAQISFIIALDALHGGEKEFFGMLDEEYSEHDSDEAIEFLRKGTEVLTESDEMYSELAWAHIIRGEKEEALNAAKRASDIAPKALDNIIVYCAAYILKWDMVMAKSIWQLLPNKHSTEAVILAELIQFRIQHPKSRPDLNRKLKRFAELVILDRDNKRHSKSGVPNAGEFEKKATLEYILPELDMDTVSFTPEYLETLKNRPGEDFDEPDD